MMDKVGILLCMVFCHIVDDYYLQGILANLKQKSWWEKNAPDKKYAHDYIVGLMAHAFSWTFMILLPAVLLNGLLISWLVLILFCVNWIIHGVVDDLKANRQKINLITDQSIHFIQIFISWLLLCIL